MYAVCYVPSFCFKKQAMGALTKGDRRAEIGSLDSFNLDTQWGKKALKALLRSAFEGVESL